MTTKEQQLEYQTLSYLVSTIANICKTSPNVIIDRLTGLCWDEEEASNIKVANMPEPNHD